MMGLEGFGLPDVNENIGWKQLVWKFANKTVGKSLRLAIAEMENLGHKIGKRICFSNKTYNFSVAGHKETNEKLAITTQEFSYCSNTGRGWRIR